MYGNRRKQGNLPLYIARTPDSKIGSVNLNTSTAPGFLTQLGVQVASGLTTEWTCRAKKGIDPFKKNISMTLTNPPLVHTQY